MHTADWHYGSKQHTDLYQHEMLYKLIEVYKKYECNVILCVGDIFDVANPNQIIKDTFLEFLCQCNTVDINFIFSVGNHDYTDKSKSYHALKYLKFLSDGITGNFLSNINVIEDGKLLRWSSKNIDPITFYSIDSPNLEIDNIIQKADILLWHGVVPYSKFNGNKLEIANSKWVDKILNKAEAKYLALGDIHQNIIISKNKCGYPGALVQKTFGCESGLFILDYDHDIGIVDMKTVQLDLPKKLTVNLKGSDFVTEKDIINFVQSNKNLHGNYLKLKIDVEVKTKNTLDISIIKSALDKKFVLDISIELNQIVVDKQVDIQIDNVTNINDELKEVIDKYNYSLDKNKLLRFCSKYTKE